MIEIKKHNGFERTVFIDGKVVPHQIIKDAQIKDGVVEFEIFSDDRINGCIGLDDIKYQIKPAKLINDKPKTYIIYLDGDYLKK